MRKRIIRVQAQQKSQAKCMVTLEKITERGSGDRQIANCNLIIKRSLSEKIIKWVLLYLCETEVGKKTQMCNNDVACKWEKNNMPIPAYSIQACCQLSPVMEGSQDTSLQLSLSLQQFVAKEHSKPKPVSLNAITFTGFSSCLMNPCKI